MFVWYNQVIPAQAGMTVENWLKINGNQNFLRASRPAPVRVYPYGSHLIIYLVEENRDVLIVRVRHGHEDWLDPDQS